MSEQQAEATQGESGSVGAGSTVSHTPGAPGEAAAAMAMCVLESPAIAPDHEAPPKAEPAKPDPVKAEPVQAEPARTEAAKPETAKTEEPRGPAKVLIMAPGDRAWHDHTAGSEVKSETRVAASQTAPKRSLFATAAMLALAVAAGAIGGALATTGLTTGLAHVADAAATSPANDALEAAIARIDADIVALKAGLDHTTKTGMSQFNKTSDRLDRIEKAQTEPAAKLAKLTEAVDKLRSAAPAPAAAAAVPASKDVTGSVAPQTISAAAPAASHVQETPPKPEVGRLPTVEGWSLRDIGYGGALIQNRRGTFEVYAGDYVPGLGRIDAIRKQDGRWVVVTGKGLIVRQ